MQRLTGIDAAFLALETPSAHMQVLGVAIVDPSTAPAGSYFERVHELLEARLHLVQPLRRRLVEVPFGVHIPVWIEDPDFDLDYHLRRAALPARRAAPGSSPPSSPTSPAGRSIVAIRCGRRTSSRGWSTAIRRSSPRCTTR